MDEGYQRSPGRPPKNGGPVDWLDKRGRAELSQLRRDCRGEQRIAGSELLEVQDLDLAETNHARLRSATNQGGMTQGATSLAGDGIAGRDSGDSLPDGGSLTHGVPRAGEAEVRRSRYLKLRCELRLGMVPGVALFGASQESALRAPLHPPAVGTADPPLTGPPFRDGLGLLAVLGLLGGLSDRGLPHHNLLCRFM